MTKPQDALADALHDLTVYREGTFNAPALSGKIEGWQYDHFHTCLDHVLNAARAWHRRADRAPE